ncbi:MAG: protein translocase subunit SecD [bacterium]|nr:protein translocase subunit SecD [bacterium]
MAKYRIIAVFLILAGIAVGYFDALHFVNPDSAFAKPFKLGLDLQGGVHLVYKADVSEINPSEVKNAMEGLRDVIERRVNLFGVAEPLVQVEEKGILKTEDKRGQRLIVELPGVTDINQAIKMIGETPFLEFRIENPNLEPTATTSVYEAFLPTGLTGRFLKKARLEFNQTTFEPYMTLEFNDEGAKLFAKITKENINRRLAVFLDGAPLLEKDGGIFAPVIRGEINGGKAEVTGQFDAKELKDLVKTLNSGALPVPISLISQQSVGPTLGQKILFKGVRAGIYGIILVAIFLILWYRLPGLISVLALAIYTVLVLAIFKLIPVTLTSAGIAGFILSVGMAVDANILIFERMKEERKEGKALSTAITEGFSRAWLSIRDSNASSLISSAILYWMGTSMVKGFALTLGIGVLVSMFSAITISRTFLLALGIKGENKFSRFLMGSGIN